MEDSLEQAAERFAEKYKGEEQDPWYDFMEGAKWQMERSYSEEEVLTLVDNLFHKYSSDFRVSAKIDAKEWFEQFKSKQDE